MRTAVLRRFPFPEEIPGFVPESLVWRAIARAGYKTRFVNQVFRVYYDSEDSLSRQGRDSARHALGLALLARDTVAECLRSEEHTSELQSLMRISYAVFCLKKKKNNNNNL